MKQSKKPIIFLLGPTAAGKTDWAINWQKQFEFLEIISVDSVMVYKECNIGSAKPSKEVLEKYTCSMTKLGRNLMRLALLSSGVKDLSVMQSLDTPTIWLRLLHYPPISKNSPSDLYGSAPHTDFGCLTILAQDEIGGLQVQTREGEWIDVPKLEGSFVVNVGDMLSRYTNGLLRSTPHRVINKSGKERFSCPFFFDPHTNAVVQPLKGTGKPKFSPINFGEFLREELEASYEKHKKV